MIPFVTYLIKIDREKWNAFKERLAEEGHTVKWVIEALIDRYIEHGDKDAKTKGPKRK